MSGTLFVPGRIEVLGKHTDYAGGRSLLVAVDRGFTFTATTTGAPHIRVIDTRRDQAVMLPVPGTAAGPGPERGGRDGGGPGGPDPGGAPGSRPGWAVYPDTVVRRVARDFPGVIGGCRIELASDLPAAAGLSSSSALVTGVFLALDALFGISGTPGYREAIPDREALAGYLGAVERGSPFPGLGGAAAGVGTRGGSEDHVAILCAEADTIVGYAYEPVRREGAVPVPAGHRFVVAASGVRAAKTADARDRYNRLSDRAARAAALWRTATGGDHPHLGAILAEPDGLPRLMDVLGGAAPPGERDALRRRVRHFAIESSEIVPAAADALAVGDLDRLGRVVDRSQELAESLLGNQVPQTAHLARSARAAGAIAASAFGAGFGGSVWALVADADAGAFRDRWHEQYRGAFPDRADDAMFFLTPAGPPARAVT